ncbi:MAG: 6-carboxytetrahydropterin synthase [Bacteroidales bacterium]|nr:6-carboxytetrahydropterin synthase [Bacteroidales bacterium]
MSIIRVTKEFRFEGAHSLVNYDGKCRSIHGHSYKLLVTLKGSPQKESKEPKTGMVIDFSELKRVINKIIVDKYDHALILREDALLAQEILDSYGNVIITPFQPTSENLIIHFAQLLNRELPSFLELYSLRLYETTTSFVEWFAQDNQ